MQMGGFDIDVGNGENSSWQWQEEQQWNQSSWENTWENSWQTGDNTSETPAQNNQTKDNEYPYNSDIGNGTQDNTQQWNDIQQSGTDWNNGSQWNNNSQWYNNSQSNNDTQNNNTQSNNNSAWNNQSQIDINMQTTPQTDKFTVKIPEETSPTSTPVPTPKPAKKKNKKKQNKTEKENKSTVNSQEFQNEENQGDIVKYTRIKDESVVFQYIQGPENPYILQIKTISQGSVQILSFRLNGTECPWHWEEDCIIPDMEDNKVEEIELLAISQGGKLIKFTFD